MIGKIILYIQRDKNHMYVKFLNLKIYLIIRNNVQGNNFTDSKITNIKSLAYRSMVSNNFPTLSIYVKNFNTYNFYLT